MYRLICQKPAHLLPPLMALVSIFFQMFIVLGMHNFGGNIKVINILFNALHVQAYIP